jgi:nucleoside-diphosphate-sugar epimerase
MNDKRVLVTGGAGFISSNLANRLAADNDVIAVNDTMADASKFRESTGWEPEIDSREGVERVCAPYHGVDAPDTN